MRLATKSGISLIVLGMGILGLWNWWRTTRNFVPVDMPLSLTAGQNTTVQFKLNFDGLYLIEIEAPQTVPSGIEANWALSSQGRQIKAGNAKDSTTGDTDARTRVLGELQGKAGQDYTLQMNSVSDENGNSPSAAANLRLRVAVATIAYTDLQSAGILVFSMAFICVLFGMILFAIAFHSRRKASARSRA